MFSKPTSPSKEDPSNRLRIHASPMTLNVCLHYNALKGQCDLTFPWKSIWSVKGPWWVSFFDWTAYWGKILAYENLIKCGYTLVGWCWLCRCYGELVDYLLLHCSIAFEMWSFAFISFGIFSGCYWRGSLTYCLVGGIELVSTHSSFGIWFHYAWCGKFGGKNRCTFMETSGAQLLPLFSGSLFDRSRAWQLTSTNFILDFMVISLYINLFFWIL